MAMTSGDKRLVLSSQIFCKKNTGGQECFQICQRFCYRTNVCGTVRIVGGINNNWSILSSYLSKLLCSFWNSEKI